MQQLGPGPPYMIAGSTLVVSEQPTALQVCRQHSLAQSLLHCPVSKALTMLNPLRAAWHARLARGFGITKKQVETEAAFCGIWHAGSKAWHPHLCTA